MLDSMQPGDELTLVGSGFPDDRIGSPVVDLGSATTEEVAAAILSVMPLDHSDESPIAFYAGGVIVDELPDVAFAVRGLASDAELRSVPLARVGDDEFFGLAARSVATVRVATGEPPYAFALRKGAC
jgi:Fucose dissimilation pathway protein FucU